MKKLFTLIAGVCLFANVDAQTTVRYPFGPADFSTLTVDNDTLYITCNNSVVYKTLSDTLVGNTVFYATINSSVRAGDRLYIRGLNGTVARTLTFKSTYFKAANVTTTASKTKVYAFIFDGNVYVYQGVTQLD